MGEFLDEASRDSGWFRRRPKSESRLALAFGGWLWLGWDMKLSPALDRDVPAIVDLVNLAFRGKREERSWNAEHFIEGPRIDAQSLREDMAEDQVHLLVHREGEDEPPIATVRLEPDADAVWHLGMLSVAPGSQDRRLGRAIMAEAETFVRARGGHGIRMSVVNIRDTLIAWYERRGYALTGETLPFPYEDEDERFGRPLRDDLHFVMLEKRL